MNTSDGSVSATQLYGPYGGVRYSSGMLPTDKGYTGQRSDASTSGLDYYGARYYDPVAGQFTSADTTLAGGLNRYAYVGGNPETFTDPSGHVANCAAAALDPSSITDWVSCGGDLLQGGAAAIQGNAVSNIIKTADAQYKGSGTARFLTADGETALDEVTSRSALMRNALESLADVRNAIPGVGKSPAAALLEDVKGVLSNPDNVKSEGPSGGRLNTAALDVSLTDAETTVSHAELGDKLVGAFGLALVGYSAGASDYSTHHNILRAAAVGALHATFSAIGADVGEGLGAAAGAALCGPLCAMGGAFLGASAGGFVGDWAAGQVVQQVDNGNANKAASAIRSGWSQVAGFL